MRKTLDELRKLNTKNLLRYYKAERKRFYTAGYSCDCGCGEMMWDIVPQPNNIKQHHDEHVDYLDLIKKELNTREHVPNKR